MACKKALFLAIFPYKMTILTGVKKHSKIVEKLLFFFHQLFV
jgi:hypothetical protein